MRFSRGFVEKLDFGTKYPHQYTDNRRGFNPSGDEKYYAVRFYEKDQPLFPKIFQVLRLGLGQVATNFPPLTAKWIYENYIRDLIDEDENKNESEGLSFLPTDCIPRLDFKRRKVFDSSAGWGGRLLGALSSKYPLHYIGLDVNKSNEGCYESLGEFYNSKCGERTTWEMYDDKTISTQTTYLCSNCGDDFPKYNRQCSSCKFWGTLLNENQRLLNKIREHKVKHPNTFEIHYKGSEVIGNDVEFMNKHKGDVDLCFTSPPYFNKEIYSDDKEQSAIKFPNYEDWLSGFLEPTIKTYFDLLKENRYCLINIADLKIGENQFHPLEQDTIQIAIKCGFEYHRKYGMVMTRTIGTNPSDMRNSWLDVKSQKTYKVEPILIFKKPTIMPWENDE